MAFTESDRVQIRQFLGYSALWLQADPRLESAIANIQSVADGGTRPDTSSEVQAKAIVTKLQLIDTAMDTLVIQQGATRVQNKMELDSAREMSRLRSLGRQYVHRLARMFDTLPRADVFSMAPDEASAYPALPFGGRSGY